MDRIALWRGQISVHGHWYCSDMGKPPYRHGDSFAAAVNFWYQSENHPTGMGIPDSAQAGGRFNAQPRVYDFPYILLFFFVIDRKKEASYN